MKKIIVLTFLTLDGVMQAPGAPEEDTSGNFKFGGWTVPYFDEEAGMLMGEQMNHKADLLLGRKTFEIFASYWPEHESDWPGINSMTKYVVSKTLKSHEWQNSVFINENIVEELKKLKSKGGTDLHVYGSSELVQTLMENDLVDEFWLKIFPVTLGTGKKLFGTGTIPAAYKVEKAKILKSGVIFANYVKDGDVKTGSF